MTRLEKIQLAIDKGFTYNPETGKIYNKKGHEMISTSLQGYIDISICDSNKKRYHLYGHQFAWYTINNEIVKFLDHINSNRSDNRICNLRSVTHQQNAFNQPKVNGYTWNKNNNNYNAQIQLNGKHIHIGVYDNKDDAKQAYLEAKKLYHII